MFQKSLVIAVVLCGMSAFATDAAKTTATKTAPTSQAAPTQTQVFKVAGMHCGGCATTIQNKVCKNSPYAKCEAALIDEKTEMGEIRITPKAGQTIDVVKLRTDVKNAGYEIK